jgi:hypothetical protein
MLQEQPPKKYGETLDRLIDKSEAQEAAISI